MPRGTRGTRLASFPSWYWEIYDAAKTGKSYARVFAAKNFAVNARHRWHTFRLELIAEGVPNAHVLTEVMCGAPQPEPGGKWSLTWTQTAVEIKLDVMTDTPVGLGPMASPQGVLPPQGVPKDDAFTALMKKAGYTGYTADELREQAKARDVGKTTADEQRLPDIPLDIPALDLSPQGPPLPACPPHEPEAITGAYCIKCNKPKEQW